MALETFAQYLVSGVAIGCIYALVAIGFNIVYNTTGVINFAQGEFVVVGALTAVSLHEFLPLPLAIVLAVGLTMLLGAAVEVLLIRWIRRPTVLRVIVITIGASILLREAALHIWGYHVRSLPPFTGGETDAVNLLGARITPQKLWVLGCCAVAVTALGLFFRFTLLGQAMRACSANRAAATLCGIPARNLVTFSFMLAGGLGALAGCVLSPVTATQYDMGGPLAIRGFTVAILGGLGSSAAAVAAGILLGIVEAFSTHYLPEAYKNAIVVGLLLAVLFVRPRGLFAGRSAALKEF